METGTNKTKQKPKYDLWQITAYMLGVAWRGRHWTVFTVGLSLALVTAGRTIAELLFAPACSGCWNRGWRWAVCWRSLAAFPCCWSH